MLFCNSCSMADEVLFSGLLWPLQHSCSQQRHGKQCAIIPNLGHGMRVLGETSGFSDCALRHWQGCFSLVLTSTCLGTYIGLGHTELEQKASTIEVDIESSITKPHSAWAEGKRQRLERYGAIIPAKGCALL